MKVLGNLPTDPQIHLFYSFKDEKSGETIKVHLESFRNKGSLLIGKSVWEGLLKNSDLPVEGKENKFLVLRGRQEISEVEARYDIKPFKTDSLEL